MSSTQYELAVEEYQHIGAEIRPSLKEALEDASEEFGLYQTEILRLSLIEWLVYYTDYELEDLE